MSILCLSGFFTYPNSLSGQLNYVAYPFTEKDPWYYPGKTIFSTGLSSKSASDAYMDEGDLVSKNAAVTKVDSSGTSETAAGSQTLAKGQNGQLISAVMAHASGRR